MKCVPVCLTVLLLACCLVLDCGATVYNLKKGQPFSTYQRTELVQGPGGRTVHTDSGVNEGVNVNPLTGMLGGLFQPINFRANLR